VWQSPLSASRQCTFRDENHERLSAQNAVSSEGSSREPCCLDMVILALLPFFLAGLVVDHGSGSIVVGPVDLCGAPARLAIFLCQGIVINAGFLCDIRQSGVEGVRL